MIAIIKPPTDHYKQRYRESLATIQDGQTTIKQAKANNDDSGIKAAEFKLNSSKKAKKALDAFKKDLGRFYRFYDFLSQIIDYEDEDLEKMSVFFRHLLPNLKTL